MLNAMHNPKLNTLYLTLTLSLHFTEPEYIEVVLPHLLENVHVSFFCRTLFFNTLTKGFQLQAPDLCELGWSGEERACCSGGSGGMSGLRSGLQHFLHSCQ